MKEDRIHVLVAYWRPYANAGGMETIEIVNLLEQHQTQIKPTYVADFHGARRCLFDDRTIEMLITSASAYDPDYNTPGIGRNFTGKDFAKEARHLFPTMPIALLEHYRRGYDKDGIMRFSHLFMEYSSLIEWILSRPVVPNVRSL